MANLAHKERLNDGSPTNWDNSETWDYHASLYDRAVGTATREAAAHLVEAASRYLSFTPDDLDWPSGKSVIDLGTGTGSLALTLTGRFPELEVFATDISPGMLGELKAGWEQQGAKMNTAAAPVSSSSSSSSSSSDKRMPIKTMVVDMTAPFDSGELDRSLHTQAFSHVTTLCALQSTPDNTAALSAMFELLAPGGCCAVGIWDFENQCGPHDVWREAAEAAEPGYVNPEAMGPGRYMGMADLREGMKAAGFQEVDSKIVKCQMSLEGGTRGFMDWFWRSGNPMPAERLASFKGDRDFLKKEMVRILDEKYDGGTKIYTDVDIVIGTRPAS